MSAVRVRLGGAADVGRVRAGWEALYDQQQAQGMLLPLAPGAFDAWARALTPVLGRFGVLALAEREDAVVGFVAGRSRALPPWFGGGQAGFVTDVFVDPALRRQGVARALLAAVAGWFADQGVQRLELQVLPGNTEAREAYLALGWREELVQLVLPLPARGGTP